MCSKNVKLTWKEADEPKEWTERLFKGDKNNQQ